MRPSVAILVSLAACGGGGSPAQSPDGPQDSDAFVPDAGPAPTLLASGGEQLLVTGDIGFQLTPANLADDADAIEIHQEIYGTPWDEFAANQAPPAEWVAVMDSIAQAAHATGKPIFLSVTPFDGTRTQLAGKTVITDGKVTVQAGWAAGCYDFASAPDAAMYQQAYLRYVDWMIDEFQPTWLNMAIEINLYFEECPTAVTGAVQISNAAYEAAHAHTPALVVFPSIQIDHLYGYDASSCADMTQRDACFDANYAQISALTRDRFAMSSYPIPLGGQTVTELPADWFTRGASRGGERGLIAETGMDSTALVAHSRDNGCITVFTETETDEAAYLARVIGDSNANHFDLANWWSDRDLVVAPLMTDCPCTFDSTWCTVLGVFEGPPTTSGPDTQLEGELVLKVFGTMGLRDYSGAEKSFYATWQAGRAN